MPGSNTLRSNSVLFCLSCFQAVAQATSGIMFKRTPLPEENWLELSSGGSNEDGLLMSKSTCATACSLRGEECHGYELHDNGTCSLGQVQAHGSNNYIPEFLMAGKRVYLRTGKVERKAVTGVNHLASIPASNVVDTAFEDTRFEGLTIPPPFTGGAAILSTMYKRNFLTCAGNDASGTYSKKCKVFNFKTREWKELPGEMLYKHQNGAAALAGGKIYAFCGKNAAGAASREAEVYDFSKGKWEAIPFAPSGYAVDFNTVVAISDTKVMLIAGRFPGVDYSKTNHIYNTDTQQYSSVPNRNTGTTKGMFYGNAGCALLPDGLRVMCAGGWNDWNGNHKRVQFYDIASNTWDTQPAYDLPVAGTTSVVTLGVRTFAITGSEDIYEYKEGESQLWVRLTDTKAKKGYNVFYTMDYTELLI